MTSRLGVLLELMHGARARIDTFEGEYRTWHRPRPSTRVVAGRDADGRTTVRWLGVGPRSGPTVSVMRLWIEGADRMRVEVWRARAMVLLGVRVGPRWWHWDHRVGASTGELDGEQVAGEPPTLLSTPVVLDPAPLLAMMSLEPAGIGARAGREVLVARGRPRSVPDGPLSYELEVDSSYGAMLRRAVSDGDGVFHVTEATAARFGGRVSPERFSFDPEAIERLSRTAPRSQGAPAVVDSAPGESWASDGAVACRELEPPVSSAAPARRRGTVLTGATIWLTGLNGAGKTTLAHAIEGSLALRGRAAAVLDGDDLRRGLSADLGFSRRDRSEHARRVAHVSALLSQNGLIAIALVSPYAEDRLEARVIHADLALRFFEVWVDTQLAICQRQDDELHEPPANPDVRVSDQWDDPVVVAERLVDELLSGTAQAAHDTGAS